MHKRISAGLWAAFFLALALMGCEAPQPAARQQAMPAGTLPRYEQLVAAYNKRLSRLDQIWSRAVVEVHYRAEDGSRKFEQGDDSKFIAVLPDKLALTVGKAGQVVLWAGASSETYWLLDLRDPRKAWVGTGPAQTQSKTGMPIAVRPSDLPHLMGLIPIDPENHPSPPKVEWVPGYYIIEPPGTHTRILIDSSTLEPRRIDLIDAQGKSTIVTRMQDPEHVSLHQIAPGGWPLIASRYEMTVVETGDRMLLRLSDMSDGREGDRIKPAAFDLDFLLRAHKIRPENVERAN